MKKKEITNNDLSTQVAVIDTKLDDATEDIKEIKQLVQQDYVTKSEFDPVKKIVYGLVALILTGVIVALISLVLRK